MMKRAIYILLTLSVLTAGCTKKDQLTYLERRAVGEYTFEKVVLHDGFLKSENVTQQYYNMILQLNDKKEAALVDKNTGDTYLGKFDIVTQPNYKNNSNNNNNSGGNVNTIIIDIKSGNRGTQFHWVGENATITRGKIRFTVNNAYGKYTYKLDKI